MAQTAARRLGYADSGGFESRAKALIGAHLWRRAARMVLACLPRAAPVEVAEALPAGDDGDIWEISMLDVSARFLDVPEEVEGAAGAERLPEVAAE